MLLDFLFVLTKHSLFCPQNIKDLSEEEAKQQKFTMSTCKLAHNRRFNRYQDVNPYDHSRIVLKRKNIDTDYINASLVTHKKANRSYILCQGPLPNTVSHFWLMIWENQSKAILMLNKIIGELTFTYGISGIS